MPAFSYLHDLALSTQLHQSAIERLRPLMAPASIALVGASARPDSFGRAMLEMALGAGFSGAVYPVNPRYDAHAGQSFYASLADIPETPEHVVLAVANERLESEMQRALERGARALTVFATAADTELHARIRERAQRAGVPICGANSMGFHNLELGLRVTPFPAPLDLHTGGVALIVQSGSIMGALAHNDKRIRFNLLVSTGAETTTTAADYLHWALHQPSTRVVGLFLETVRDPDNFCAALAIAAERNIPVVLLKVGRTEASARMAISHTGALVGDHSVFSAVVARFGAHLVDTVDELAATLQVFAQSRNAVGVGIASIHDSGGERELFADLADDIGVPYASISERTQARLVEHLEPGLEPDNPLDAWGSGRDAANSYRECALALIEDEAVAAGVYVLDWRQDYYLHQMHAGVLIEVAAHCSKPFIAATNYSLDCARSRSALHSELLAYVMATPRDQGAPIDCVPS
ncbi:MAG: CoA-binding protein, partial [Pseudomonadota bacterium]